MALNKMFSSDIDIKLGMLEARCRDRKKSLDKLRHLSEELDMVEHLRHIFFDGAPALFAILDSKGHLIELNDFWGKMGLDPKKLLNGLLCDFVDPEDSLYVRKQINKLLEFGGTVNFQCRLASNGLLVRWSASGRDGDFFAVGQTI